MALGAEIHEGGFQGGFDAGDLAFVDIGFFLHAGAMFDVQIIESLAIHQRNPNLFGVRGIDQHTFHCATTRFVAACSGPVSIPVSDLGSGGGEMPVRHERHVWWREAPDQR